MLFRCLALLVLIPTLVRGADAFIEIREGWVMAVPPSSSATAAFMTIVNRSEGPVRISRCTSTVAKKTVPMITTRRNVGGKDVMGMEIVESFAIPAGGERELKPGGDHIMLMEMKAAPKAGEEVDLMLVVEPGAHEVKLKLPVRSRHERK